MQLDHLSRTDKVELLALLEERERRARQRAIERERHERLGNLESIRQRCKTLAGFVREAWHVVEPNTPYVHGWHIDAICAHLEAITWGEIIRLLVNVPPGTMKSLLVGVFWPAWEWGPCGLPALRYLGSSYSEDYAKRDNNRMRMLITSEWYQSLWPTPLVKSGETEFTNEATGFRKGVPFSRLTGGRGDRVLIDDPHSTEEAESEAERARAVRIFTESVTTRLNDPQKSAIIVIMQRLHQDDVSGVILSRQLGYVHLMLPMEFEPERKCVTSIGFEDPRKYEGELLFPERFPRDVVERDKRTMGTYAWAGQGQQRPAPRTGGMFDRDWFKIRQAIPAGYRSRVRAWDLAATKKTASNRPDWTAGILVSRGEEGDFLIEGMIRFQGSAGAVRKSLKNQAPIDGATTTIRLTQDPGQAGKAQAEDMIKDLAGYSIIVKPATGEKTVRANPAAIQAEAGNVYLLVTGDPDRDAWIEPFLTEVCLFPAGSNDDQVDALADAINELTLGIAGATHVASSMPKVEADMWNTAPASKPPVLNGGMW